MTTQKPGSTAEYIEGFPVETQVILEEIRQTILKTAPDATETISYDMPSFLLNGKYLLHFAAWKHHIGFYPVSANMWTELKEELSAFKGTKSAVQFPLKKPMPLSLIEKMVEIRVNENRTNPKKA